LAVQNRIPAVPKIALRVLGGSKWLKKILGALGALGVLAVQKRVLAVPNRVPMVPKIALRVLCVLRGSK
jgi:hypothetical protein